MITLYKILKNEFENDGIDTVIQNLESIQYYSKITNSINLVNRSIKSAQFENSDTLHSYHIVSYLLFNCCHIMNDNTDMNKSKIKSVVIPILKRLYIDIILSFPEEGRANFARDVDRVLRDIAFIFDISYCQFSCLYRLNKFWMLLEENKSPQIPSQKKIPGLVWNQKTDGLFDKFLRVISELNIANPEQFKLLFKNPKQNLNIELNFSEPDFVLQFLSCLKESKFVSYYNARGFYQVFRAHIKDFDLVFLKNRNPQRRVDTVKNLVTWLQNKERIDMSFKRILRYVI